MERFNGFCCLDHALCEETQESFEAVKHFQGLIDSGKASRWCGRIEDSGAMVIPGFLVEFKPNKSDR